MRFSVHGMMKNSFVLVRNDEEYESFSNRMLDAGFYEVPKRYIGKFPYGLSPVPRDRVGLVNCALAHFSIVNMALSMDWDHVTIFESDALPMIDCKNELGRLLEGGVPDDAQAITFGSLHFIRENGRFLYDCDGRFGKIAKNLWGSHAVTIFGQGYRTWLDNFLSHDEEFHADWPNELLPHYYATVRSYFVQWKDGHLDHGEYMVDKQNISDFPVKGR